MKKKRARFWKNEVNDILLSKQRELHLLGYPNATVKSIWKCLEKQVWKGNPKLFLFEVVGDIFSLTPNVFMDYLTVETYAESDDLMASIQALKEAEK